ncbi:MAG: YkgJ family cysteine cluster protein [Acidobacteriaceae bacterium]
MNQLPARDAQLVQIMDAVTAQSQAASGAWLACRPGCTQCCHGVFAISQLDALRLRQGLEDLAQADPARAAAVLSRARSAVTRLSPEFPGDSSTGTLDEAAPDFDDRFDVFANDEPCAALDPATGLCDLYSARPTTCRLFGLPIPAEEGLAVCELCFVNAPQEEVARCAVQLDSISPLEDELTAEAEAITTRTGATLVAFALAR